MPKLDLWSVITCDTDPYLPPEQRRRVLSGYVYGHPNCYDGESVRTSLLIVLDVTKRVAQTKNTSYELGDPCPVWLGWLKGNGFKLEEYDKCETKTLSMLT